MRKAVIISLDAVFEADLGSLDPDGALARLMREGASCTQVRTVFPALTYPCHVTLVSGCDPDRTGVGQNQPFQPDTPGPMRKWYWESRYVQVPTLFDAVRAAGGKSASILWPVNCRNPAVSWCLPEVHALPGENQTLKALRYGTPFYCIRAEKKFGKLRRGASEPALSDFAAAVAADTIRTFRPALTAVHLIDTDSMRHHHGTFSPEAAASLSRHDARIDAIRRALAESPGMEDALLIIVSDHGQADIHTAVHLQTVLAPLGLEAALLPQSNGMSAYLFPGPDAPAPGDREAWARIERTLTDHLADLGASRLYTREELLRLHAAPGPILALEATKGVAYTDRLDREKREKATHGFGPGHPAENCLFAAVGKGIMPGKKLSPMPMRDVGPTIAGLMGLSLPESTGTDHSPEIWGN